MTEIDAYELGYRIGAHHIDNPPTPIPVPEPFHNLFIDAYFEGLIDIRSIEDINFFRHRKSIKEDLPT